LEGCYFKKRLRTKKEQGFDVERIKNILKHPGYKKNGIIIAIVKCIELYGIIKIFHRE